MSGRFKDQVVSAYRKKECPFNKEPSFEEALMFYLNYIIVRLSANTYTNYRSIALCHILTTMGEYELHELDYAVIQCYVDSKLKEGRIDGKGGLCIKTVREHINFLNGFFKQLIVWGVMTSNPCDGVIIPKAEKKETQALDKETQAIIHKIPSTFKKGSLLPIKLSMLTGFRIGEVCALTVEDIDFEKRIITINKSLNRVAVFGEEVHFELVSGTTKSKKPRIIPMNDELFDILYEYFKTMPEAMKQNPKQPLFVNGKGNVMEPRLLRYHFYKFCKEHRIKDVHFHLLRHTFASNAIEVGVTMNILSKLLGHANTSITENVYVHISEQQLARGMALLNRLTIQAV